MGLYEVVVLGVLIRGLQNLESPFGKVLILFVRNRHCGELLRGLENLEAPERETGWYFLQRAKSTTKTRRGLRPSGLPGTIQISARYEILAEMTGVHQVTGRVGNFNLSGYRR